MSFLYGNVAAITVALVASLMAWLFGGARGDLLLPVVPWLLAFMVEVVFCFPQRKHGETTYEARARVCRELKRSPVVWVSVGFLILLAIPFVNNGLCPGCDAALIAQGHNPRPPLPSLPYCVDRLDHLNVVLWFSVALLSVIVVAHGLTQAGRRLVLALIVWNGAVLAVLGFVQQSTGAPGPFWCVLPGGGRAEFFSAFGYPNMAGDYFTTLFGLGVALWREQCETVRTEEELGDPSDNMGKGISRRGRFWRKHFYLVPALVCFFAALNTLSRATIILASSLAVVFFAHTLVVFLSRMTNRSRRVFVCVWSLVVFGLLLFFATITMPEKMRREVRSLDTLAVLDRVTGKAQYHSRVATALWKDHPMFGCGGWGYSHLCGQKMTPAERNSLQDVGGANVHNDLLQFLTEHGVVGCGALVTVVLLLLWPVFAQWRRMCRQLRFAKGENLPPKPVQIFVLPAPVLFVLLTAVATLVHACGDCPMRSCAVLTLFFVSIAAVSGFMPSRHELDAM